MDIAEAKRKFDAQKDRAKHRGIEWRLTFQQWVEWWGDDIDRRGTGYNELQMQRKFDLGAYELGNISKGVPRQNARTRGAMQRNASSIKAAADHQTALDNAETCESKEWEEETEDEHELRHMFRIKHPMRSYL